MKTIPILFTLFAVAMSQVGSDVPIKTATKQLATTRPALRPAPPAPTIVMTIGEWHSIDRAVFAMHDTLNPPHPEVWPGAVAPVRMRLVFENVTVVVDLDTETVTLRSVRP